MGSFNLRSYPSIFKMETTIWLSVILAVISLTTPTSSSEPRVVCYYTNWSVYRPGTARFNPQNINPYLCTHLIYAFGGFTKDNTLKPFDKYQDIEKGGYAKFTGLKTYNKELKTMLAIGGWNEGSSRFSPMVGSRDRRKEFVRNAIKFLRQNRFDGLDLDWEYPSFRDGSKPKDRENYAKLVRELREEFEREAEKTGKPRLLLTMAVPAGIEYIQKGYDVETLNRYLDWMNLLTYDYHSAFEPAVNHHAPLYPLEEPNEYSVDTELNIDYTIKFYLENGADRDKLVLGIPTYGRSYTLFNADAVEIGSPADGPGEQGDATKEKGYLAYYEICESVKPKKKKRETDSEEDSEEYSEEEEEDEEWTVMHPNPNAMGPVAFRGNQWVGYDDIDIVKKKAEYVAQNGLGGIMFWSIDNDDFRGTCHGKPYPLIEAAKEAYIVKLGSTDNAVFEKPSSSGSRSGGRRKNRPKTTKTTTTTTTTTTPKPTTTKSNKRKNALTSSTPSWNIITPEPPTTPDPGSDFKCVDEGFYPHPRDCKKYFWCLDSGPSNLGIVAHQFTCPSGLYFNKAADSCDFSRNVLCKQPAATTKAPPKPTTKTTPSTTTTTTTTTRKPLRISTRNSVLFRTTTTTTTPEPESEEYEDEQTGDAIDDAEDPKVIKELIDLIKKVGGIEQLEKQLHLSESPQPSTSDGIVTTTPTSFNKKLYQKVLERARGKNKFGANSILENAIQNSQRGPQNQGIEPASDKDKLLRKDRPQYTTINRQRPSTTPEPESEESEESEEVQSLKSRAVEAVSVGTTTKQYVNIRRARPTVTSDTADDTASRNSLFERQEPVAAVSDTPNSLDILSARRENVPEYVTIRRQRPTTEETTTIQYQNAELEDDRQQTALEKEISSQPQYTSIIRTRSTTIQPSEEPTTPEPTIARTRPILPSSEEPSSPEPTTVLAVQISSLLNSLSSEVDTIPETTATQATEPVPTTTTTVSTTTTTTTAAPSSAPTRRTVLRRRGPSSSSTTSTTSTPSSTQVSPRIYAFRRRRPLANVNEISDSEESGFSSRRIRSTTPDSRESDETVDRETRVRGFRGRFQGTSTTNDDSVPAAAFVSRGRTRPQITAAEKESLTPVDEERQIIPKQFNPKSARRFRIRPAAVDQVSDSEPAAATVEVRRPSILPRGRSRFTVNATADSTSQANIGQRRPTFARFTPRPFTRPANEDSEPSTTQRIAPRLPFGRTRPSAAGPVIQARKLPFPSRQSTTTPLPEESDEDPDSKNDDISLSETAIEEQEHDDYEDILEDQKVNIEKIKPDSVNDETLPTEALPVDDLRKKKFRVIRRRPSSTTTPVAEIEPVTNSPAPQRIRKIIRKKIKSAEDEPEIIAKSIGSLKLGNDGSSATIYNYGEKTKSTIPLPSTTVPPTTTTTTEQVTEKVEDVAEIPTDETKSVTEAEEEIVENILNSEQEIFEETKEIKEQKLNKEEEETKAQDETKEQEETKVQKETEIEDDNKNLKANTEQDEYKEEEETKDQSEANSNTKENTEEKMVEETTVPNIGLEATPKLEVVDQTEQKTDDVETKNNEVTTTETSETETGDDQTKTTTVSTTPLTSPTPRTRLPYRPQKRLFTSTTQSSIPSSSRIFSRKYNPGVYTSPATLEREPFKPSSTRRPFPSKIFTRKPFTPRTTPRQQEEEEEEEYSDDEELLEEEPENPFIFVPQTQLFTRKPDNLEESNNEEENEDSEELLEGEEDIPEDEKPQNRFTSTTRKLPFKPRIINSNTFRSSAFTTEIPNRLSGSQNRTGIITRFISNKPSNGTKTRVQNVPKGYNTPVTAPRPKIVEPVLINETQKDGTGRPIVITTTNAPLTESEGVTTQDDDYLSIPEAITTESDETKPGSTNTVQSETATVQMEIDTRPDEYLENTEATTDLPTTQLLETSPPQETTIMQTEPSTTTILLTTQAAPQTTLTTTTTTSTTTTTTTPPPPIIKTQFDKLFSVSRVVEVSSKLDKHRLNKNNETTLIEEGPIKVEKKPVVDKIGEVSRFSLIKIVEDEIPIYLTKLGHVYPVDNPPDNPIRIDEARNARALNSNTYPDLPKESLIASESINEAYRHVKAVSDHHITKNQVEHVPGDDFLSYVNHDNKDKTQEIPLFAEWQFVPAAYETEKAKQNRKAKSFEIITPRSVLNNPSTLPLEGLFKTKHPMMARKVSDPNQPFIVYSASVKTETEKPNNVQPTIAKSEPSHNIVTFVKGQEFSGAPSYEETTVKYLTTLFVAPTTESTTSSTTTTDSTSPIIELLTTQTTAKPTTSTSTTTTTTEAPTTEVTTEETTTFKPSPLDAKRNKFAFPKRTLIKTNLTRTAPSSRAAKNISTVTGNLTQKSNKTVTFNSKPRLTVNRVQNVPVDVRKKIGNVKATNKSYTTEVPKTTTERKSYFKQLRPGFQRPTFVPRKITPPQSNGDT